jgi:hypothetical protein
MSVREDFFLATKSVSLTALIDHYGIPARAVGNSFKVLFYVDSAGNERKLSRIDVDERHEWANSNGGPLKFYLEGDEVVLVPKPSSSSGSLLFSYFRKPNRLIATTSCAKITGISSAGGSTTFMIDTDLTGTLSIGDKIDFVSGQSPFLLWTEEVDITAITATTIEVATTDVSNAASVVEVQTSDYICPKGYSNIPMIPEEFHPVLAQMTAVRLIAGLGDLNKRIAAKEDLAEVRREALKLVKNRVESSPEKVAGRNPLIRAFGR